MELAAALDALAPRTVVVGEAPRGLVHAVAAWVATRSDVTVSRADGVVSAEIEGLLVTDSTDRARAAIGAGWASLVAPATELPVVPEQWTSLDIAGGATLIKRLTSRPDCPPSASVLPVHDQPNVAIVIPIHNAGEVLKRCLDALARNTTWPAELVLVDDASSDPHVEDLLTDVLDWDVPVTRLRNSVNLGFTASVNRGLRATNGDVVVLNSDTEVGPRWLERLHDAAHRDARTGSATACSDNAGAFSVPVIGEPNRVPLRLDFDSTSRLVAQLVGDELVSTPTGNGFCMYIRRTMLTDVGLLDEQTFPRGYGEENDLSLRARARGWQHVTDPGTFVHHVREASFGPEKQQLSTVARAALDARYPGYSAEVADFVADPAMRRARMRVAAGYDDARQTLPRVLFVVQEGGGGTPLANFELMRGLQGRIDCLLFTSDRRRLRLDRVVGDERITIDAWDLARPTRALDFSREDYRKVIEHCLRQYAVDLLHVRHLFKHSFDAPVAARRLGIPTVFSFHDFYFVCPTVNLLDDHDHYCAGRCTPGFGSCRVPPAGLEGLPPLKHAFVHQWQEEVTAMLAGVDAFVTTSPHARSVHIEALPSIGDRPFKVIPHGRALSQAHGLAVAPEPGRPVRIAIPGNLDVHKGADYLRRVKHADVDGRLEFHFLGEVPARYEDLGVVHGRYEPDELRSLVADIRPSMIGLFSICAETFSHSLTEAWSMGIPVVATDLGAFGERLREHEGGWLIPVDDAEAVVRRIVHVADEPDVYVAQARRADLRGCHSVAEMTDAYGALYAEVLDRRRTLAPAPSFRRPRHLGRGTRRTAALVPGAQGVHPGSTYVRIVQPLRHPRVARRLPAAVRYAADGPIPEDAELVMIQRTAVPPEEVPVLLAELEQRDLPMVLDLDDHLLLKDELDVSYGPHQRSLGDLLDAATLVTVSTTRLEHAIGHRAANVAHVANCIDESLFLAGIDAPPARARHSPDEPVRLVYMGSPTHADDLAMLKPVLEQLNTSGGRGFELEVVGVQPPEADSPWFKRITIPDQCKPYPRFVGWLREQRPRWDIALAPLADTQFNSFKSDLKWLECAALGLPFVASEREPYRSVVSGVTGHLVSDDVDAWIEALLELTTEPDRAQSIVDAAWNEVVSTRLLRHGADALIDLLMSVERDERG